MGQPRHTALALAGLGLLQTGRRQECQANRTYQRHGLMAKFCPSLTLTFPSATSSCHLQLLREGLTPSRSRSGISESGLQQGQGIRSLTKEDESKGSSYGQKFLMTPVINLSRAYKLPHPPPPQFQGDTLPQPSSSDLEFLTLAD